MENKKGFSNKIVISIIALVVIVGAIFIIKNPFASSVDGTIEVEIVDIDGQQINDKKIGYNTGDKLVDLLEKNFDNVDVQDGFLYSIDTLTTPEDWSTWICIYVDDTMSEVGIEEIQFEDGTKISFVDTEMSYDY